MCGADEKKVTDFISLLMFALLTSVVISFAIFPSHTVFGDIFIEAVQCSACGENIDIYLSSRARGGCCVIVSNLLTFRVRAEHFRGCARKGSNFAQQQPQQFHSRVCICLFICFSPRRFHVCVFMLGDGGEGDFMSKGFFFHSETVCLFYDAYLCCYLY